MNRFLQIAPEQASTVAGRVDALFYFLCVVSIIVTLLISGFILVFFWRYRQKPGDESKPFRGVGLTERETKRLEMVWIGVPLVVFLVIFWWGAKLFAAMSTPPDNAMQIYVVGKQWMWKVQHLGGKREINELHVPVGTPVKLTMTSEDVIHDFYVPAFRVKQDVMPGRYTTMWFEATKVGEYHLFCAEYCGTKHSEMIGKVVVMEPRAFETWLGGGKTRSLSEAGEQLFNELGCATCHNDASTSRGPQLKGLFGRRVQLASGEQVLADESYLRESILAPQKKVVAGYQPVMPTYVAQLTEEKVIELIAYIRSLAAAAPKAPETSPSTSAPLDGGAPSPPEPAQGAGGAAPGSPTGAGGTQDGDNAAGSAPKPEFEP